MAGWPPQRIALVGSLIAMAFLTGSVLLMLLNHILLFDGFAANGAFQLLNPLRRIAAGEAIGNDFNFFHGVGVPLLHLPVYYLFGQGFLASEVARWIMSPGLFIASAFLFFYVLRRQWLFAINMTVVVTVLGMWLVPSLILPLTSLLSVRSVVPVILMAVILKQDSLRRPLWHGRNRWLRKIDLYECLVALLLALGFICGTEFGMAAILGFAIANSFYRSRTASNLRSRLLSTVRVFGMMAVWLLAILAIITRGTPLEPIKFALGDVPIDQFWYFGVPPNEFLDKHTLLPTLLHDNRLPLMLLVALVVAGLVLWLHRLRSYRNYCQAFIFGLLAGTFAMVSMLGYYHNSEAAALVRMSLLVGVAAIGLLYGRWRQPILLSLQRSKGSRRHQLSITPRSVLSLLALGFVALAAVNGFALLYDTAKDNHARQVVAKAKQFILGRDSNLLGPEWHTVDSQVMPIIQADNNVAVVDINNNGYTHGVDAARRQLVIDAGKHANFIRPGQIIYLPKAGRQIIEKVDAGGNRRLVVTLQNRDIQLDPQHDGAPARMIVAEDFEHNDKQVWLLYSGLIDQEMGTFQPTHEGYDYIIHALGPERRQQYIDDFRQTKPDYVLTLTRPYFRYEEWVQNAHWDFYSLLDENYDVVRQTSIYNVWKRRDGQWSDAHRQSQDWQQLVIDQKDKKIALPALSFDNVPDIEALGSEQQRLQREQRRALGFDVPEPVDASEDDYDRFKAAEKRAEREYLVWRKENSGNETDDKERAEWLTAVHAGRDPYETPKLEGSFHVARPKRQVILVRLQYQASHPLSKLPLFGKTTRYMVEPNNTYWHTAVSLRPYSREVVFPLVISEQNKEPYLRLKAYSILPGDGKLQVTKAEWMPLETTPENLQALTD